MPPWHEALSAYRRRSLARAPAPTEAPIMFIVCSECYFGAELAAAFRPAVVLQLLAGTWSPSDAAVRATFEYAIGARGVRQVVLYGHEGCCAHAAAKSRQEAASSVASLARSFCADEHIGELIRRSRVKVGALFLDESEGDIYACDVEGGPPRLLSDGDLFTMFGADTDVA